MCICLCASGEIMCVRLRASCSALWPAATLSWGPGLCLQQWEAQVGCVWSLAVNSLCRVLLWQKALALELSIPDLNPVTPAYRPWPAAVRRVAESDRTQGSDSAQRTAPQLISCMALESYVTTPVGFHSDKWEFFSVEQAVARIEMWRQLSWGQHRGYTQMDASCCLAFLWAAAATAEERAKGHCAQNCRGFLWRLRERGR